MALCRIARTQAIEAGQVGDGRHHGDIGNADVRGHVAGCEGGDHDFGDTIGNFSKTFADDRGTATPTDADDAGYVRSRGDEAGEGSAHRGDRRAAIHRVENRAGAARVAGGNLCRRNVGGEGWGAGTNVDKANPMLRAQQSGKIG